MIEKYSEIWVKLQRNFGRAEKFLVNLGHILKKCKSEKLVERLEKLKKFLEIFE